jgi:hypothetical protein
LDGRWLNDTDPSDIHDKVAGPNRKRAFRT